MSRPGGRFELLLSAADRRRWDEFAQRAGLSTSAWVRRCCEEAIATHEAIDRDDAYREHDLRMKQRAAGEEYLRSLEAPAFRPERPR
jgi:hypothetical protein